MKISDKEIPYTRIIEQKWFLFGKDETGTDLSKTIMTKEYSANLELGMEKYYPVNDVKNNNLYKEYKKLAEKEIK